jgi:hypothetical protein
MKSEFNLLWNSNSPNLSHQLRIVGSLWVSALSRRICSVLIIHHWTESFVRPSKWPSKFGVFKYVICHNSSCGRSAQLAITKHLPFQISSSSPGWVCCQWFVLLRHRPLEEDQVSDHIQSQAVTPVRPSQIDRHHKQSCTDHCLLKSWLSCNRKWSKSHSRSEILCFQSNEEYEQPRKSDRWLKHWARV